MFGGKGKSTQKKLNLQNSETEIQNLPHITKWNEIVGTGV